MRLEILNHGYRPGTKLLFAIIKLVTRQPVPDAARLVFYRPDFYGARADARVGRPEPVIVCIYGAVQLGVAEQHAVYGVTPAPR